MRRSRTATTLSLVLVLAAHEFALAAPPVQPRRPLRMANNPAGPAAAQQAPPQPRAPFELTPAQVNFIDNVLDMWEKKSAQVNTFTCKFIRWEYDPVFAAKAKDNLRSEGRGEIKYRAPDHGVFRMREISEWDEIKKEYVKRKDALDLPHWVCDGKSIFEFNHTKKQLIEHKLPPEMQGKGIADGPLPFVFGAKAATLKARYFIRDITPTAEVGKQIWLDIYPRFQRDAANFEHAELILTDPDFLPFALQLYLPGAGAFTAQRRQPPRTAYVFQDRNVNAFLDRFSFKEPAKPFGWQKVVEEPPSVQQAQPPAKANARQARGPVRPVR